MDILAESNVSASVIGKMTAEKTVRLKLGDKSTLVDPPEADELYKVVD